METKSTVAAVSPLAQMCVVACCEGGAISCGFSVRIEPETREKEKGYLITSSCAVNKDGCEQRVQDGMVFAAQELSPGATIVWLDENDRDDRAIA